MRRIEDDGGRLWDVVVGRESWGAFYALFVPVGEPRDRPVRQALLDAEGNEAAHTEVREAAESHLLELLGRSGLK